ncbi:hypothetical protein H4R19_006409 [Coemansia spiralis]|nr:hypothetical protein H4R19_006409 [Coemansia spiralis]
MAAAGTPWTPDAELALFQSMVGLRPIGIHRHFRLLNIYTRLQQRLGKTDITLGDVRRHIGTLFDMPLLDEIDDDYGDDDEDSGKGSSHTAAAVSTAGRMAAGPGGGSGSDASSNGGHDSDGGHSMDSGSDGAEGAHDSDAGSAGRRARVGPAAPASAIGAAPDTTDPNFWRRSGGEFSLPWSEYGAMMVEKAGVGVAEDRDEDGNLSAESSSVASTPNAAGSAVGHKAEVEAELEAERESSDGRVSPVARQKRGRSSTPVSRNRTKAARSSASSTRRRQRPR